MAGASPGAPALSSGQNAALIGGHLPKIWATNDPEISILTGNLRFSRPKPVGGRWHAY
jgi:hypothetical protein